MTIFCSIEFKNIYIPQDGPKFTNHQQKYLDTYHILLSKFNKITISATTQLHPHCFMPSVIIILICSSQILTLRTSIRELVLQYSHKLSNSLNIEGFPKQHEGNQKTTATYLMLYTDTGDKTSRAGNIAHN